MTTHIPQPCYLGVIPQQDHLEYGFRIINEDKTARLLILSIENSVFKEKRLMMQEAPDLCYQKVLADLVSDGPSLNESTIAISDSDIEQYRATHPNTALRRRSLRKISQ